MKKLIRIFLFAAGTISSLLSGAQTTQLLQDPDAAFKSAKELYQQEKYSLAYPVFKTLYNNGIEKSGFPATVQLESKYYSILCGLQLNDAAAEPQAVAFVTLEHDVPRVQMMSYHLAEYYYRTRDLTKAQEYYQKTNIANLSNREIAEMKFHQAYGYFAMQQFDKARPLFNAIRQLPKDPNYTDANYYYGFIAFNDKNYTQALESFRIAEKSQTYQNIVPFYIAEIYYFSGDRDQALSYGEAALSRGGQYYDLQLKQLVGHLLFEKRQYAKALPYLEQYVAAKDKVRREDLYELAYCYYEAKNWPKSIEGFKQLGGGADSLAQNSMYLLADAYLKVNDKQNARSAFQFCAANNSNAVQKEISLFNYAKLSYDLGYMDIALKGFKDYLAAYPSSALQQEAKELLVSTMANTSNYREGLALYESLPGKSENAVKIYPRLLYGRAVELINDQQIIQADELLTKVLTAPYNNQQLPFTYFWKGEIAYRTGNTDAAITHLTNYLKNPSVNGEVNTLNARYSLGYALLKNENYAAARENFSQIAGSVPSTSSQIQQDAYLRTADCHFMAKDFKQALRMYEQVLNQQLPGADYALFQKAVIAGASNKNNEKIALLQSLERQFPASAYKSEANLEIANTYLADENFQAAIEPLNRIVKDNKATALHPEAYLKLGVAYFNLDKNTESLAQFKKLVATYPNTQESTDAIEYIRNLFVENQQPGEFVTFMRENGKPVTYNEEDSLTFRSAMLRYDAKDMAGAKTGFAAYLAKFPDGRYNLEANYFSAEIYISEKDAKNALTYYATVAGKAQNRFAERSALQAARIYYFDLKDYVNAEKYFIQAKELATQQENRLEAMRGLLRCQFKAQKWKEAAPNAQELLQEKGIATDDRMMASMVVARNHHLNNEAEQAAAAYRQVIATGKSEYSAEAQYRIAELLLQQDKLADAEKAAFDVIKKSGSYEYWVTKSYMLLGDIYFKQKDLFNAEATYKSIAENAAIAELKTEAQRKLAQVVEEKNKSNKVEQQ
ncbi:tetratricopeptide repeat protein [Sediminibacterium ginsengisoli]|uniref:Tetratricopeptide repeat-containing protein n=1 Tax=Sediminibacterium ginsengisoli TaxID=413434 RepID=A0A1T4PLE0_9BACT|nr:tetratricopeptide repeat protein [Sediminibacterium ginsengisoli]SJZ92383.1 Tetratricopeptide repeat-containing protein [Sediminibacterium ginsengisoli]